MMMKKSFFSCFHPLVLETKSDQINVDPTISPSILIPKYHKKNSSQRNNSKRPLSQVLEILLLKASLKIKVSDRNVRKLLLQPKNATLRRISRHLLISGDDKTRGDKGVEEAKVEIRSSGSSSSYYESKNERSSTVAPPSDHEGSRLMTKPCSCKTNPSLYLFVVTLFFTVVWGRVRAVLFALVFIYLLPFLR